MAFPLQFVGDVGVDRKPVSVPVRHPSVEEFSVPLVGPAFDNGGVRLARPGSLVELFGMVAYLSWVPGKLIPEPSPP